MPRLPAYRFGQMALQEEQRTNRFLVDAERLTYMTPEQYRSERVTAKSDQYSLGLLAVEMLQGEPPVTVQHLKDLDKKKEFFEHPEKLTKMMRERAPLLADVVLRMLEDNPDQRWVHLCVVC